MGATAANGGRKHSRFRARFTSAIRSIPSQALLALVLLRMGYNP